MAIAHLATIGQDGYPYVCPLLYVWLDGRVWLHNTSADGHLLRNVRAEARACFEVSIPGKVFAYGRYECDTLHRVRKHRGFRPLVHHRGPASEKARFFDALMSKYR
jgi:hypothetical protein